MSRTNEAPHPAPAAEVAELQGLYGPYHFSELLLQAMWLRGEFDQSGARTEAGEVVRILHPGKWNRLSGPDFRNARLIIGDREVCGDIEIHFRAASWRDHGHHRDPAFENVVLHVVLFPPEEGNPAATTRSGRELPVMSLVGLLWHDLEEYATDHALLELAGIEPGSSGLLDALAGMKASERAKLVREGAEKRWAQKLHFSRLRIDRLGWSEACHQTALEILGYRSNRAPMLRVAAALPLRELARRKAGIDPADLLAAGDGWWTLRGVRPANHPQARLAQYCEWVRATPDWPDHLAGWLPSALPAPTTDVAQMRREMKMPRLRQAAADRLFGGSIGGSRLDTLVCNLVLPFLAARDPKARETAHRLWYAWYPGDTPNSLRATSRFVRAENSREPEHNGLNQGLLALQLERGLR